MLAYILALAVALASLALYMAAFFFPEVHRKNDFIWSGVGMFYALVLWVCAGRITGGVLLGQIAGVTLLGWFGWQTLKLRRELIPVEQQTEIPSKEQVQQQLSSLNLLGSLSQWQKQLTGLFTTAKNQVQQAVGGITKGKGEPATSKSQKPTTAKMVDPPTKVEVVPLGAEYTPTDSQPGGPNMPGASATIEKIAPEVEIAPPAEPVGLGSPEYRQPAPPPVGVEAVIIQEPETSPTPPSGVESAPVTEAPELVKPHPPAPEIVEAALEDAEAKSVPASPPESAEPH